MTNQASALYGKGDGQPFRINSPADVVVKQIEEAKDQDGFVALQASFMEDDEEFFRTIYIRPSGVWAISPWSVNFNGEDFS